MKNIGKTICEARKLKGLTQEELSELSNVNLRTIQRIENNENVPRNKTVILICEVLQLNYDDLLNKAEKDVSQSNYGRVIVNVLFLLILNFALMGLFGYLTLDSEANLNSRFGGLLLSFFLPFFIVWKTQNMSGLERILKFGSGFFLYIILIIIKLGFPAGFVTGLFICLTIALAVLFYGNKFIEMTK